jgi:hypothetical protein
MGRRGNPNWGKPLRFGPVVSMVTSFEEAVKGLKLQPDQYLHSTRLREWARRNKNSKFIPESLLQAWGFDITKQPFTSYSTTVLWKSRLGHSRRLG